MADQEHPDSSFPPDPAAPPSAGGAPGSAPGGAVASDDRTMGMLCHLLAIFTWFIGPLVVWLMKKDSSAFVDDQGKEAVNFQITVTILYIAGSVLACFTFGISLMLVGVLNLVFCIMATVAASNGERYRYPFALRLIR